MARNRGAGSQRLTDKLPLLAGAVAGAAAYVTGMILTFLLLTIDGEYEFGSAEFAGGGRLDEVGWLFYSSHFANIEATGSALGAGESDTFNAVSEFQLQFPAVVYYLVPVVLLISASIFVVASLDLWDPSPADCAQAGTSIVVGYLPLALAGTFLYTASISGLGAEFSIGPEPLTSILLVGLLFPLLFGAVGGVLFSQA